MDHMNGFEASIETWRGMEPLNLEEGPTGLFILSSLRKELATHRPFPPNEAYYQLIPHCVSGGMLFLDGTEFDVDSDSPGVQVTFVFDDENPDIPCMYPIDAMQDLAFTRSYLSEEFTYQHLDTLKLVAITRLASTN